MGHDNKQGKSPGFVLLLQTLKGQGYQENHEPGRISSNCPVLPSANMTQQPGGPGLSPSCENHQ